MLDSNFLSERRLLYRDRGPIDEPGTGGSIDLPGVPSVAPTDPATAPTDPTVRPTDPAAGAIDAGATLPTAPETAPRPEDVLTPEQKKIRSKRIRTIKDFDEARDLFKDTIPPIGVLRSKGVGPQRWHFESEKSINEMWADLVKLRLPVNAPFYIKLKEQLLKPYNGKAGEGALIMSRGDGKRGEEKGGIGYYRSPHLKDHAEWLQIYDEGYYNAVLFIEDVKQTLIASMKAKEGVDAKKDKESSNPIFRTVTDHLQRGGQDVARAFREKDYGMMALYATGFWAGYKILKPLFGADPHAAGGAHASGDLDLKKLALWGAGAYAAYHIADRAGFNIGKKLGLEDKNSDVRGTVFENMVAAGVEGSGALEAGLLLALSDTPVKSMYKAYKDSKSSSFIHPDQFPGQFANLKRHKPLDINKPKTANQRFYVETGKKLFALMDGIILMYGQVPNKTKTFEQEFVQTDDVKVFTDLGIWFSRYYSALGEKTLLNRGDGLDAAREDLKVLDGKLSFHLEHPLKGGHIKGYINSFPVVFIPSHDRKSYAIKHFGEHQKGPAESIAIIPVEAGAEQDMAIRKVEARIKEAMLKLLEPVEVSGGVPDIQFDGTKWYGEVNLAGAEYIGMPDQKVLAYFYPLPNGQGIEVEYNGMRMPLNWGMEKQHQYNAPIISELVYSKSEYTQTLLPFVRGGQLKLEDRDRKDNKFQLVVADIPAFPLQVEVKVTKDPAHPEKEASREYLIDANSIKDLLGRAEFADKYAKAVDNLPEVDSVFDRFRNILAGAPQSFVYHFIKSVPGWFSGATSASLLRGIGLDDFSGSIPDEQVQAILNSKRSIMRDRLKQSVKEADTLEKLKSCRNKDYDPGLIQLELLSNKFGVKNLERLRAGRNWDAVDFDKEIFQPLAKIGNRTETYSGIMSAFQADVYGLLYGKDDWRKKGHVVASRVITVFAFYTSSLDDGLDDIQRGLIDIPRVADDDPQKLEQKRAIDGARKIKYMRRLHDHLIEVAGRKADQLGDIMPPPEATVFWEIGRFGGKFEDWVKYGDNAVVSSINISDDTPILKFGKENYIDFSEHEKLEERKEKLQTEKTRLGTITAPTDKDKSDLKAVEKELILIEADLGKEVIFRGDVLPEFPEANADEFEERLHEAIRRQSDFEKAYVREFKGYLNSIKRQAIDDDDININAITAFENEYLDPRMYYLRDPNGRNSKYLKYPISDFAKKTDYQGLYGVGTFQSPQLWGAVRGLEQALATGNVSRATQDDLIRTAVRKRIDMELFAEFPSNPSRKYFQDVSFWEKVKAWWRKP